MDGKTVFIPDSALDDPSLDKFKRWPFSQRLAKVISSRTDKSSIVIGVYGAWGEGKTTVLNFIESELKNHDNIICIKFNPWRFTEENQLIINFFTTLAEALERNLSSKTEKVGEFINKYATLIAPLTLTFGGVGLSPGQVAADAGSKLASVDLEELKDRIQSILQEEAKRVVIFMDDIDRLDKSEIQAVFKLVKLSADFDFTAYILAFDESMVAAALQEKYAGGGSHAGKNFLEKIIQVPLNLPHADQISLRQLCFQGVDQALNDSEISLSENEIQEFVRYFVDGLEIRLKTPRMCKRYANALSFALPILKGEVNIVDLMLIEGLRVFYSNVYEAVRHNPDLFVGTFSDRHGSEKEKEAIRSIIDNALTSYNYKEIEAAKDLLQVLFPKLKEVFGNIHFGRDWEGNWEENQRVASKEYFNRFFSYAIPEGDISDIAINQFLETIENLQPDSASIELQRLISQRNADKVVLKLRQREKALSEKISKILALSIASSGAFFPNPEQLFSFTTAWSQAAILVHKLLKNIKNAVARHETAQLILDKADLLPFKLELYRWMRSSKEEADEERTFSKEIEESLGVKVASAVKDESASNNIYKKYGDESHFLFYAWANFISKEEVSEYLQITFSEESNNVIEFLKTYLPTAWGRDSGIPHKGDFERSHFDAVASLIDPEIIYSKLTDLFGNKLEGAADSFCRDEENSDLKIALQFSYLHHFVIKEKEKISQQSAQPDCENDAGADADSSGGAAG